MNIWIRKRLVRLIGPRRFGALKFHLQPEKRVAWGGPMNGQGQRCRMVAELILKLDVAFIVETGTFLGTTTEWLAAFQLPVFSCEASPETFGFSEARLGAFKNVELVNLDSRSALNSLIRRPSVRDIDGVALFYLDAHWNLDIPLREEVDTVFGSGIPALVVVDDFEVPDDGGYQFDNYGPGRVLGREYIRKQIDHHELDLYYPAAAAAHETGARRGCVVLARKGELSERLASVASLRRAAP